MSKPYTDTELADFLLKLDESHDVHVTGWEAEFIGSNLSTFTFSFKQRQAILTMIEKYGKRIGWL